MPVSEGRHTLAGTALPEGELPPTLLFHKWHRYDCFVAESCIDRHGDPQELKHFSQNETGFDFLSLVAKRVQEVGRQMYDDWHGGFEKACKGVEAELALVAQTDWRMVIGWATNPALEVGLSLDHLYGFPFIPGSAVKGLVHRMAELELGPLVPTPPASRLALDLAPPQELSSALDQALRLRVLFGSLHLRPDNQDQPSSALVALEGWRDAARRLAVAGTNREPWKRVLPRLETVCSDAATGGMVTCFDAVPGPASFTEDRPVLKVDVLTPHTDNKPTPLLFLAVRDGLSFEFRYRLAGWPATEPRDEEEAERAEALAGLDPATVKNWLRRWLVRGLGEQGLGGKTTAGYGYFRQQRQSRQRLRPLQEPPVPEAEKPEDTLPPAERHALRRLPDGIDSSRATNLLDDDLSTAPSLERTAVARRFLELFPGEVEKWEKSSAPKKAKRLQRLREAIAEEGGDG